MGTSGKEERASSNWERLQKTIGKSKADPSSSHGRKRRKLSHSATTPPTSERTASPVPFIPLFKSPTLSTTDSTPPSQTVLELRALISSPIPYPPSLPERRRNPGQYIAIDCEMVGVGPLGSESSLARVSVVNYYGTVLCDLFVRQKERVTDWRTRWSGIRETDMKSAKSFEEVQATVADLMKGRILIGHAVHNDLHALLLSHPRAQLRDTQLLAHKHGQSRVKHPSLKNLVRDMLGVAIQEGEHSSVIDARATMAIFRLHRKEWERPFSVKGIRVPISDSSVDVADGGDAGQKRKRPAEDTVKAVDEIIEAAASTPDLQLHLTSKTSAATVSTPQPEKAAPKKKSKAQSGSSSGGRQGISSGLSTVITRRFKGGPQDTQVVGKRAGAKRKNGGETEKGWWKVL